ncbi:Rieske 2Fe-2S domain-containing protein [Pseudomonas sp. LS1212]|uniref:Rieske 2Fe-2S domain-containing protein n=1 Tax=Pseudomonas sp. LS1212 TaxID=2972478 RepID=UPI00215C7011|nr:Rieske 2Fe-2S domain-containing protein [Pseudomonas sp. LS1212]UVJ42024.1 Rieske 2Fe-2S domain-containing protein [Pseudomonas sp. LS1212]
MVDFARIISKLPSRYARGWHCFGLERNIKRGEVTSLEAFGTELVAFRGEDGQIRVFDAYCPHMGANLANGTVKGNTLECPFHSWQWGDAGYCEKIPYCDKIPPKARIRQWESMVENELLFIWHDHEGKRPIAEQKIPAHRCCSEDGWSDWAVISKPANTNCRELIDNLADVYHFEPVHGSPVSSYLNVSEGHTYCQMLTGGNQLIGTGDSLRSIAYYYGPSYVIADMEAEMWGYKLECIMMIGNVPINHDRFMMHFGNESEGAGVLVFFGESKAHC